MPKMIACCRGSLFHELQLGPLVLQLRRRGVAEQPRFAAWRDPYWRS